MIMTIIGFTLAETGLVFFIRPLAKFSQIWPKSDKRGADG
jgi:hypothetical protein